MASVEIETITLKKPIEVLLKRAGQDERTETIAEVEFHEFRAKDLRAIDGLPDSHIGSQMLALMARMIRQPVKVVDELGAEDFQMLSDKVRAFLPSGQPTGQPD